MREVYYVSEFRGCPIFSLKCVTSYCCCMLPCAKYMDFHIYWHVYMQTRVQSISDYFSIYSSCGVSCFLVNCRLMFAPLCNIHEPCIVWAPANGHGHGMLTVKQIFKKYAENRRIMFDMTQFHGWNACGILVHVNVLKIYQFSGESSSTRRDERKENLEKRDTYKLK